MYKIIMFLWTHQKAVVIEQPMTLISKERQREHCCNSCRDEDEILCRPSVSNCKRTENPTVADNTGLCIHLETLLHELIQVHSGLTKGTRQRAGETGESLSCCCRPRGRKAACGENTNATLCLLPRATQGLTHQGKGHKC